MTEPTPTPPPFTVTGTARSVGDVVITWTPKDGFSDPLGLTADLIGSGQQVCATATGPCYTAAAKPAVVAYLTAVAALDTVTDVQLSSALQAQLDELTAVPSGAVA